MPPRLSRSLIVISSVLLILSLGIWLRSYWRSDALAYYGANGHRAVQWDSGRLFIGMDNVGDSKRGLRFETWRSAGKIMPPGAVQWLGFGYTRIITNTSTLPKETLAVFPVAPPPVIVSRIFFLPMWALTLPVLLLPLRAGFSGRRVRKRRRAGQCTACGYDLRGTPERCPECGKPAL